MNPVNGIKKRITPFPMAIGKLTQKLFIKLGLVLSKEKHNIQNIVLCDDSHR